jgi:hypothetical protein
MTKAKALKLALEVMQINLALLKKINPYKGQEDLLSDSLDLTHEAITATKEALAQPEQELWCMKMNGCLTKCEDCPDKAAQPDQEDGCPVCGSDVHDRDALDKAEREIERLTALVKPEPEQEPVAWIEHYQGSIAYNPYKDAAKRLPDGVRFNLCITPPATQRQWVGLTVAEMEELTLLVGRMDYTRMLQLAEAKLKEKNT